MILYTDNSNLPFGNENIFLKTFVVCISMRRVMLEVCEDDQTTNCGNMPIISCYQIIVNS